MIQIMAPRLDLSRARSHVLLCDRRAPEDTAMRKCPQNLSGNSLVSRVEYDNLVMAMNWTVLMIYQPRLRLSLNLPSSRLQVGIEVT